MKENQFYSSNNTNYVDSNFVTEQMKGTEQSQPFTPRKTIKDVLQMIKNLNFWAKIRIFATSHPIASYT